MTYPQQPYGQVGGPPQSQFPEPAPVHTQGSGGWQPQQGAGGWQPPPAARPPWLSFGDFVKRVFSWGPTVVTSRERLALETAGVRAERLQHMLVWRRSVLIMILPVLILAFLLALLAAILFTAEDDDTTFTGLGLFSFLWVPAITMAALAIGAVVAIVRWTELRLSMQVLFWSWLVATVVPLCTAIFPVSWVIDIPGIAASGEDANNTLAEESVEAIMGTTLALLFAVVLVPIIIGLAGGALRGARRTKSLFPATVLPGWFVIVVAPLYTIVMLTIFAVVSPVLGSGQLTIGVLLLALAPLVYIIFRGQYTRPMTRVEAPQVLSRISLLSLGISLAGMALIVTFVVTGEVFGSKILGTPSQSDEGTAWFSYVETIQMGLNLFVRYHLSAVVMCFLFASIAHREWQTTTVMGEDVKREHEADMRSLRRFDDATATDSDPASRGSHYPVSQSPAQQGWHAPVAPSPGWNDQPHRAPQSPYSQPQ